MTARLRAARSEHRAALLRAAGLETAAGDVLPVAAVNLAGEAQVAGLALGRLVTLLLLFFLFSGGAVVAQDTLAGEKERGTLETLLTTAITRREIVTAKVLLVLVAATTITGIQVVNLLVYVGFGLIPTTRNFAAAITPGLAAGLLVFLLPLAALVAGMLVLVSGYARSYREAQLYFLPLMLASAVPAMAAFLPAVPLRSAIAFVPIANISVGAKELLVGRVDWLMMPVAWLVTAAAAGLAIRSAARLLSTERLIVPTTEVRTGRGGEARAGQLAMWFLVMWAVLLVVSLNAGAAFDIRLQLVVNLVGIMLGGSLLFIRRFGLDARRVLSLRMPHPATWVAVLVGIPAGLVTGVGIFRLSQFVLPVPREMLEHFAQYFTPDDVPFWQLLLMMTILPGICEEITFRGVLLHGVRRHVSAPIAILIVGLVFGLFHVSLFRILQTAYLGVIFATVTVLSGSIVPAMVWHAGSNALALGSERFGFTFGAFEPSTYAAAAALLAASFWIIWRTRTRDEPSRVHASAPITVLALVLAAVQAGDPLAGGRKALSRGDVQAAVKAADDQLERDPRSRDAIALKVEALAGARDWEWALDSYEAYLAAGGREDVDLVREIAFGTLRETLAFYPSLRPTTLGRLACAGDRDALLELRREQPSINQDVETLGYRARLGDDGALAALRQIAGTAPIGVRASALLVLLQLEDAGAEPAVLLALGHPEFYLRLVGVRTARALALASARPHLELIARDPNALLAGEALAALAVLGVPGAVDRVRPLVLAPSLDLRVAALEALVVREPSAGVLRGLSFAARTRTSQTWTRAVELLLPRAAGDARAAIREGLTDSSASVRTQALRLAAFVPMDDPGDLVRLRQLLRDDNLLVRVEAATVLVGQTALCGA
jgi:sodium transport system permease protein